MIAGILAIVAALIGYFTSKKSGANDGTAAAVGLAAGAGTYWTATQTDWGKAGVEKIEGWFTHPDGTKTPGNLIKGEDGKYRDSITGKIVETTGDVLQSWGPAGTAGVLATSRGVFSGDWKWILIGGGVLATMVVLK